MKTTTSTDLFYQFFSSYEENHGMLVIFRINNRFKDAKDEN
jgi:hypothetical protein